jgi:hypothetical protein
MKRLTTICLLAGGVIAVSPLMAQDAHQHGDAGTALEKSAAPAGKPPVKPAKGDDMTAMHDKMKDMHSGDHAARQKRMQEMHEGMKAGKKPADAKPGVSKDGEHKH